MSSVTNFNAFVVGLQAWVKNEPESPSFKWGCHRIAFAMPQRYPKTQVGLIKLLEQPIKEWYPYLNEIPEKFDCSYGFLDQGKLSKEAEKYYLGLEPDDLPKRAVAQRLKLENTLFRKIFLALKKAYANGNTADKQKLQAEYVALRRFLIEHPYTNTKEIKQHFRKCQYATVPKVGDLYRRLSSVETQDTVWLCDRCGPLTMESGNLKGIKPEVCSSHSQEADWIHEIALAPGSRQLLKGLHLTVLIPGVPELALLQMLQEVCQPLQAELVEVVLYPEIDCYDLQLRFSDRTVWAIDVKDVPNPLNLAGGLARLNGSGSLKYDEGIYVVPQTYVEQNPGYLIQARSLNDMQGMEVMGTDAFEGKVNAKIKQLQRGQKK